MCRDVYDDADELCDCCCCCCVCCFYECELIQPAHFWDVSSVSSLYSKWWCLCVCLCVDDDDDDADELCDLLLLLLLLLLYVCVCPAFYVRKPIQPAYSSDWDALPACEQSSS